MCLINMPPLGVESKVWNRTSLVKECEPSTRKCFRLKLMVRGSRSRFGRIHESGMRFPI